MNIKTITSDIGTASARQDRPGRWTIAAESGRTVRLSVVTKDEAGFAGRQWTSSLDGQQYPTAKAAAEEVIREAKAAEDIRKVFAFIDDAAKAEGI